MATVPRYSKIRFDGTAGTWRAFEAYASSQDTPAGQSVTVTVTQSSGGEAAAPGTPDSFRILFLSGGATIANLVLNATATSQTRTFFFTTDGLVGGAARSGIIEILLQVDRTSGGPTSTYNVDSDGSPNTPPSGFTSTLDRGFIRGTTDAVTTLNSSSFAYPQTITATTTLGAAPYVSRQVSVKLGTQTAVLSAASTSTVFTTALGPTDNRYPASVSSQATLTTFPNDSFAGAPWTSPALGSTPDSRAPYSELVGTVLPALVASPFAGHGNALSFDGVNRGLFGTSAVDCGKSSGLTVTGPFTLEAKVRTGASVTTASMVIAGRWSGVAGGQQPLLYVSGSVDVPASKASVVYFDAGGFKQVFGTTTFVPNTNYTVAATYDGTTLRLFVNGVLEASVAGGTPLADDGTCRFLIGADDDANVAPAPYPWLGIIDEVRLSKVARYTSNYTPATAPLTPDANTLGLWHFDSVAARTTPAEVGGKTNSGELVGSVLPSFVPSPFAGLRNHLTRQQASLEESTEFNTVSFGGSSVNLFRLSDTFGHGSNVLHVESQGTTADCFATIRSPLNGGGGFMALSNFGMVAGQTYTFMTRIAVDPNYPITGSDSRGRRVVIYFNGGSSQAETNVVVSGSGQSQVTFTVPANATSVEFRLYNGSPNPGNWVRFDRMGLFAGTVTDAQWVMPGLGAFGNALSFDGVNRGAASSAVDCGSSLGLTVSGSGAAAAFSLEAKVRTGASIAARIIAGRWNGGTTVGGGQPVLHIGDIGGGAFRFFFAIRNGAGTAVFLPGNAAPLPNTNYDVAATYDGTRIRLFVNGTEQASTLFANIEAPDTTTRFFIGSTDQDTPFPWLGSIDEVRLSNTARYTANYNPASEPFTPDANTLGLWHLDSSSGAGVIDATASVDPRLTFEHLHQDDNNAFGTPPSSKEDGLQRLTSSLGFLNDRVVNAAGAGVNGVTWTSTLRDAGQLVPALARSTTSSAQGGQDGWGSPFLAWPDQLPIGSWTKTAAITAPAGAVGLGTTPSATYRLVASDPNLRMIVGAGPALAGNDVKHVSPGDPVLVGLVVFNLNTTRTLPLDTDPVPSIAIGRFNLTMGRAEYLAADGATWAATNEAVIYYHALAVSPGDGNVWTKAFVSSATWSSADVFIVGKAAVNGVPVGGFQKEIVVNGVNNHRGHVFDGAGFVGFPSK